MAKLVKTLSRAICLVALAAVVFAANGLNATVKASGAESGVTVVFDASQDTELDETGCIASSTGGKVKIEQMSSTSVVFYAASDENGGSARFLKTASGSDNRLKISVSDEATSVSISVSASAFLFGNENVKLDIRKYDEADGSFQSVLADGMVTLDETQVKDEDFNVAPIAKEIFVSGLLGGEYVVYCEGTNYISKIVVTANCSENVDVIKDWTMTSVGYLPMTASTATENGRTYYFLGWIDDNGAAVSQAETVAVGTYHTVYVSLLNKAPTLLIKETPDIKFSTKIFLLDDTYQTTLVDNNVLNFNCRFTVLSSGKVVNSELPNKNHSYDNGILTIGNNLRSISAKSYATAFSFDFGVGFNGVRNMVMTTGSGSVVCSAASLAREYLDDLCDVYDEDGGYIFEVWVEENDEYVVKFSKYSDSQRETLELICS